MSELVRVTGRGWQLEQSDAGRPSVLSLDYPLRL
jgi:hypothetical protein